MNEGAEGNKAVEDVKTDEVVTEDTTVEEITVDEVKTDEAMPVTDVDPKEQEETPKEEPAEKEESTEGKEETSPEEAEPSVDVEALLKDIDSKDEQVKTLSTELEKIQGTADSYKAEIKALTDKTASYEAVITQLIEAKMANVPEDMAELVPAGDVVQKLEWLNKAEAKGLFGRANPQVEIGKQMRVHKENPRDLQRGLTATQKMSNSFGNYFRKK